MSAVVVVEIYGLVGRASELVELLARPSEARLHRVAETLQLADPGPPDPRRAD